MQRGTLALAIAASAVLALGGCAVATQITTPSGQPGYSINCSSTNDMGRCFKKAGELCGTRGYDIISKHDKSQGFWSGANQTLVIQCKTAGVKYTEKPQAAKK